MTNQTQTLDHQIRQCIHFTRRHDSQVRSEHEFFWRDHRGVGGHRRHSGGGTVLERAAFRKYVETYRSKICTQIVGWQTEKHRTEHEVLRLAREHFHGDTETPRFA